MKKTIVILLTATLCFNSMGYFVVHCYLEHNIKSELKSKIKNTVPAEDLIIFILNEANASDFKWIHNREFRYQGTMFDVVSKEQSSDGNLVIYCISDEQETELFKNLGKFVQDSMNDNAKNSGTRKILNNLLTSLYLPVSFELQHIIIGQGIIFHCYLYCYVIPDISVTAPPPKS